MDFNSLVSEISSMTEASMTGHLTQRRGVDSGIYKAKFLRWWEEKGKAEKQKEDDAIETINRRLDEVVEMIASRQPRVVENTVDRMNTPLRDKVKRLASLTPRTYRRLRQKERGAKSHAIQKFRYASTMVLIIVRKCQSGRKYSQADSSHESSSSQPRVETPLKTSHDRTELRQMNAVPATKTSIGWDLQMNLTTQPEYRTTNQLKHIIYMIRANKAFSIFPSDSEMELARCLSYERYDSDRIIACQGRAPDRFYYIVSGRVDLVREYELETGMMTKSLGFLKKGSVTDTEELEKQWDRRSSLVCKGPVEVLLLDKEDFFRLQNSHAGPPVEFLQSQYLFSEFPCHLFTNHPEAIEYKFYRPERLVARDANNTRWIYIIKSGKCKCIRRQFVADVKSDKKFSEKKAIDKLGYVKQPSHADAMMGAALKRLVQEGQNKFDHDSEMNKIEEVEEANIAGNPHADTLGICMAGNPYADILSINIKEIPSTPSRLTSRLRLRSSKVSLPSNVDPNIQETLLLAPGDRDFTIQDSFLVKDYAAKRRYHGSISGPSFRDNSPLPPLSTVMAPSVDGLHDANGCFMNQREKPKRRFTHSVEIDTVTPPAQRRAYIQLDGMGIGDIFGLNDVACTASSEPCGVSVVSEGAEIIKINKRFFRTHAGTVTLLKLDTLVREFMTEEDASENLERQETWLRYKTTMMERLAQNKYQAKCRWKRTLKPLSFSI